MRGVKMKHPTGVQLWGYHCRQVVHESVTIHRMVGVAEKPFTSSRIREFSRAGAGSGFAKRSGRGTP